MIGYDTSYPLTEVTTMLTQGLDTVANEPFVSEYERQIGRIFSPDRLTRLHARMRGRSLDRALIAGADPAGSRQLAARAAHLTSQRSRALTAAGLERLVRLAAANGRRWRVLVRPDCVLENASAICELASLLRGSTPVYAAGVAIVNRLLTDGTGAAYVGDSAQLARELARARTALAG
jgi:hypothetical protein